MNDNYLASFGIRMTIVKKYLLFYIVDEKEHTVNALRFLYARRNWLVLLKKSISEDDFSDMDIIL